MEETVWMNKEKGFASDPNSWSNGVPYYRKTAVFEGKAIVVWDLNSISIPIDIRCNPDFIEIEGLDEYCKSGDSFFAPDIVVTMYRTFIDGQILDRPPPEGCIGVGDKDYKYSVFQKKWIKLFPNGLQAGAINQWNNDDRDNVYSNVNNWSAGHKPEIAETIIIPDTTIIGKCTMDENSAANLGSLTVQANGEFECGNYTYDVVGSINLPGTFTCGTGTLKLSGGTQNVTSGGNVLYHVVLSGGSTIYYMMDDTEIFNFSIATGTTLEIDAVSEGKALTLSLSDIANAGFLASTGTRLCQGNGTYGVTITAANPGSNRWHSQTSMKTVADYTTISYYDIFWLAKSSEVEDCTFDNGSGWACVIYSIVTFNNITVSNYGNMGVTVGAPGTQGNTCNNVTISGTGSLDVRTFNEEIEFADSNFSTAKVSVGNWGTVVSKNHNDVAGDWNFWAYSTEDKSNLINDFTSADNVTIYTGELVCDVAAAHTDLTIKNGATFNVDPSITQTITATTGRITVESGGTLDWTGGDGTEITLESSSQGTQWELDLQSGGTVSASWVLVEDSNATPGLEIDGTDNCTDVNNNDNWDFGVAEYKNTISGLARVKGAIKDTISGVARVKEVNIKDTISGLARVVDTIKDVVSGTARVLGEIKDTVSGLARIKGTDIKDIISGAARILSEIKDTISGSARVKGAIKDIISGLARVKEVSIKDTISGLARVLGEIKDTIGGAARVIETLDDKDLYLRSDVDKGETSPDKDLRLRALSDKGVSVSEVKDTISGIARVLGVLKDTLGGAARVLEEIKDTKGGLARIEGVIKDTISGLARIKGSIKDTIGGIARVKEVDIKDIISGLARVVAQIKDTVSGTARVLEQLKDTIGGDARIKEVLKDTISGITKIVLRVKDTISGATRIKEEGIKDTISGLARAKGTIVDTISGMARVLEEVKDTIPGSARIKAAVKDTISGLSKIVLKVKDTISGGARVKEEIKDVISGFARIGVATIKSTLSGLARVKELGIKSTVSGLSRVKSVGIKDTLSGIARVVAVVKDTVSGAARVKGLGIKDTISGMTRVLEVKKDTVGGSALIIVVVKSTVSGLAKIISVVKGVKSGIARIKGTGIKAVKSGVARVTEATKKYDYLALKSWIHTTLERVSEISTSLSVLSTLPTTMELKSDIGIIRVVEG